jgi:hypothetical protein
MRRIYWWSAFGLVGLSTLGYLWLQPQSPKPIKRAAIQLTTTTPRASATMGADDNHAPPLERVRGAETVLRRETKPDPFGPPNWAPRPAEEWQGMLVNLNITPPCNSSTDCGLARACLQGVCMPCDADADCGSGEACVLQHCIQQESVECRRAADCDSDSKCVLSEYSNQPRGNEDVRAYCVSNFSGAAYGPVAPAEPPARDPRASLRGDELREAARRASREE